MSSFSRKQKRNVGIGGVIMIIMIIVVFIFWGGGSSNLGNSGATVLAKVNGEAITRAEFQKKLLQRIQAFESQLNQTITPELLKQLKIPDQILSQMINEILVQQEAKRYDLRVSNQELSEVITTAPVFQDDKGAFSLNRYKNQLARIGLTPAEYEEQVRAQLLSSKLTALVSDSIVTSKEEAKLDYLFREDQRDLEIVKIDAVNLVAKVVVLPSELDEFIKTDTTEINNYYETHLEEFKAPDGTKTKELDEVRSSIAERLLKEKLAEEKAKDLSLQVLDAWKNNRPLTELIAPYKIKPTTTGPFSRATTFIPQVGRSEDITTTAFKLTNLNRFPAAPIYVNGSWVVIKLKGSRGANLTEFAKNEKNILKELTSRKTNDALRLLFANMQTNAKITKNSLENEEKLFQ